MFLASRTCPVCKRIIRITLEANTLFRHSIRPHHQCPGSYKTIERAELLNPETIAQRLRDAGLTKKDLARKVANDIGAHFHLGPQRFDMIQEEIERDADQPEYLP